ncbi:MAG: hypothetical protein V1897_16020 [Pseudomonadota bacterium]
MSKIVLIAMILILTPAVGSAQGILDSVMGPGGLGIWGGGNSNQFNYQQFQGQEQAQQQGYNQGPNPYAQPAPGYGPPQGYSAPPAYPNYSQQGVYSDWQNYQGPAESPQGPPPVRYTAPPPQQTAPPQSYGVAPQVGQPQQLRPGQYSPHTQPQAFDENLPAGAVRITTQTPDGTTVQYYPPAGEEAPPVPKPRRGQSANKPARVKKPAQEQSSAATTNQNAGGGSIAMPKPMEIPRGQDPRTGWNSFGGGVPSTPPVQ